MLSQPYAAASIGRKTDVKFNVKDINMFFGVIRYTYWDIILQVYLFFIYLIEEVEDV